MSVRTAWGDHVGIRVFNVNFILVLNVSKLGSFFSHCEPEAKFLDTLQTTQFDDETYSLNETLNHVTGHP